MSNTPGPSLNQAKHHTTKKLDSGFIQKHPGEVPTTRHGLFYIATTEEQQLGDGAVICFKERPEALPALVLFPCLSLEWQQKGVSIRAALPTLETLPRDHVELLSFRSLELLGSWSLWDDLICGFVLGQSQRRAGHLWDEMLTCFL